mmetsp:Transcript_60631/g.143058  ORF Transcript_60631/g.143058 Transcript_60631/m.143058 type:complete len:359 (-) Transcript_60631:372-1448(-)
MFRDGPVLGEREQKREQHADQAVNRQEHDQDNRSSLIQPFLSAVHIDVRPRTPRSGRHHQLPRVCVADLTPFSVGSLRYLDHAPHCLVLVEGCCVVVAQHQRCLQHAVASLNGGGVGRVGKAKQVHDLLHKQRQLEYGVVGHVDVEDQLHCLLLGSVWPPVHPGVLTAVVSGRGRASCRQRHRQHRRALPHALAADREFGGGVREGHFPIQHAHLCLRRRALLLLRRQDLLLLRRRGRVDRGRKRRVEVGSELQRPAAPEVAILRHPGVAGEDSVRGAACVCSCDSLAAHQDAVAVGAVGRQPRQRYCLDAQPRADRLRRPSDRRVVQQTRADLWAYKLEHKPSARPFCGKALRNQGC